MRRRLVMLAIGLVLTVGCSLKISSKPVGTAIPANDVQFVEVTSPDGTKYQCLYVYRSGDGLWCERAEDLPAEEVQSGG